MDSDDVEQEDEPPKYRDGWQFYLVIAIALCVIIFFQSHSESQKSPKKGKIQKWAFQFGKHKEKIYSQFEQDGVIDWIFKNIGTTNKFYVEFGFDSNRWIAGGGANTRNLNKHGWTGLLLDGGHENLEINLHKHLIFPHNIVSLFDNYQVPSEPDYVR